MELNPYTAEISVVRARLLELIKELAVVRKPVILSSGQAADFYIDLRQITLHHEAAPLVGRVMLDLFERHQLFNEPSPVQAVGGLTLGADPVANAIMHTSVALNALNPETTVLDAFVVRKENKAHGLQRQIEGPEVTKRNVVAVEDTSTTGSSVLTAAKALENAGANIQAIAVIMHRATAAKDTIEAAGYRYLPAFELSELGL